MDIRKRTVIVAEASAAPACSGAGERAECCASAASTDRFRAGTHGQRRHGLLTVNVPEVPFWLNGGDTFYRRTTHGEHRFMLVDVATGVRLAVDPARLAAVRK
ncbi:hypothetical protein C9413_23615 [Rhizobium sp. SEMIA 4085]|uniref:hypothetical protein n=1 Tax=Rhizobium sp. SEMIA 4085 TaxID=2137761 RepID=UPI00147941B9|nr:hypothetical protein [Rhizobium sp. SEMIA 4085]NNH32338.1 hypothetical protein [Rhizobium sp. SEMIA 4085]